MLTVSLTFRFEASLYHFPYTTGYAPEDWKNPKNNAGKQSKRGTHIKSKDHLNIRILARDLTQFEELGNNIPKEQ